MPLDRSRAAIGLVSGSRLLAVRGVCMGFHCRNRGTCRQLLPGAAVQNACNRVALSTSHPQVIILLHCHLARHV